MKILRSFGYCLAPRGSQVLPAEMETLQKVQRYSRDRLVHYV